MPAIIIYTNPLTPGICQMPVYVVGDDQNWSLKFNNGTNFYNPTGVTMNIGFIRGLSDVAYASAFQLVDRTNSIYTGSVTLASGLPGALTWDENPTAVFGGNGAYIVRGRLPQSQIRKVYVVSGGSGLSTSPTVRFNGGVGSNTGYGGTMTATVSAGAVTALTITNRGNRYAAFPELIISGDGTGAVAYVGAMANGQISSVVVLAGGSGYTAATVQVVDPEASFSTATIGGSSGVTSMVLGLAGSGYTSVPTIAITGGGGASATATAALVNSTWGVSGLTVTNAGTRYATTPTVSFSGGTGSGAAAIAVVSGYQQVVGITPIGVPYVSGGDVGNTTVAITGGGGTGAAATPVYGPAQGTNYPIIGFSVTNQGSGYTSTPTVIVTANVSGFSYSATPIIGTGALTSLMITSPGTGYGATAPTVTITAPGGGGTTATATAQLIGSSVSSVITITAAGSGYTSTPAVAFSGGAGTGATATAFLSLGVTAIALTQGGYAYSSTPDLFLEPGTGSTAGAVLQAAGPLGHSVPFVQSFSPVTAVGAITCTPSTSGRRDASGNLIYDDALLIVRPRYLVQPTLTLQGDALTWTGFFTPATTMVQAVLQYRRSFTADVEIFGGGRLLFIGSLTIAAA